MRSVTFKKEEALCSLFFYLKDVLNPEAGSPGVYPAGTTQ
ncbi:hypothetical protein BH09BAC6_BH09BAC6_21080 [soil metagenome]|jgi:hypothetical protein